MNECYAHPGTAAVSSCIACGKPICGACKDEVAGHAMCRACVAAQQSQLATEVAPAAAPAVTAPVAAVAVEPCGLAQYVKAAIFGFIAAIIAAIIWDKFVFFTNIEFGLMAVLLGVAVGIAICAGAEQRPGVLLPWMGALLALFSIWLGYGLLAEDHLSKAPLKTPRSCWRSRS